MNTQSKMSGFVLGGLLIVFGVMALLETFINLNPWVWVAVLTTGGLVVFGVYIMDRAEKWLLIASYAMLAVAGLLTLITLGILVDSYVATYVLLAIATPFLVAFLFNRTNWGLLVPFYVLLVIGIMVSLLELGVLVDSYVATFVLLAIAFPFLVAFLLNRTNWGLLIPFYVQLVIGIMVPLLELGVLNDTLIATYVLLAIALPFFVVYVRNTKNWWALIPGGILAVIGIAFLIAEAAVEYVFPAALIVGGILVVIRQFTKKEGTDNTEVPPEELTE